MKIDNRKSLKTKTANEEKSQLKKAYRITEVFVGKRSAAISDILINCSL